MSHYLQPHMLCLVIRCLTLCDPEDCSPPSSSVRGDSPGRNSGVSCHDLLQGIFPIQGLNPGLLHHFSCILYHLSHQRSPQFPCPPLSPRVCSNSCHWVSDTVKPSHSLLSSSPFAFSLSQHQGFVLFFFSSDGS